MGYVIVIIVFLGSICLFVIFVSKELSYTNVLLFCLLYLFTISNLLC